MDVSSVLPRFHRSFEWRNGVDFRRKINEQWLVGANKYELEKALAVAISKLKISSEEKIELATMCGYKVEDGKIKLSRTK